VRALWFAWVIGFVLPGFIPAIAEPPPSALAVDLHHLPWGDGEKLTYLVSWVGLEAAQGVFTAKKKDDHWEFELALASRGLVDDTYPFTGTFWSIMGPETWRSVEYGEYRFEPKRTVKERTRIDYDLKLGTRENWAKGETKTFSVTEDGLDDLGSMLYHLRAGNWKPGDKHTLFVYESNSEKQASVECQAREMRAFGNWPKQPVLRMLALPTKGTRRRGSLRVWITDDARHLPLHAELDFYYGTFAIDLMKADKTLPASH
jgi:hypothetical protein